MTLIVTTMSKHGTLQISDSNVTTHATGKVAQSRKVFDLGFASGAVAVGGEYVVGLEPMESWLPQYIAIYRNANKLVGPTISGFAHALAKEVGAENDAAGPQFFHITGYADDGEGAHPEFWFVRNMTHIDEVTGEYQGIVREFMVDEHFWSRDYPSIKAKEATYFETGGTYHYFNGHAEGRIVYRMAFDALSSVYRFAWGNPRWEFRAPADINELAGLVEHQAKAVTVLFLSSKYQTPPVGGEIQVLKSPAPPDSVAL